MCAPERGAAKFVTSRRRELWYTPHPGTEIVVMEKKIMSNKQHRFALAALIVTSFPGVSAGYAQDSAADANPLNIQTTDYLVPHISTVPANAGKHVELFVREKVASRRAWKAPVVLMIAGATISAVPDFDLQFENYSWMEYLATAGFDVFAMDVTGYGLSPRPMMDDTCNNATSHEQSYLIPKPLVQPCSRARAHLVVFSRRARLLRGARLVSSR